jgi:hypothetical protein
MKKNDLFIVIIFIIFLIGPSISYFFLKNKMDLTNYENRILSAKPELTFNDITNYPTNFENYFNDNLPYRNEIRKFRALLLYKCNISPNTSVIIGDNGWLFYNAVNNGDPISDYRKNTSYTIEEKEEINAILNKTNDYLSEKNIEFYILVAPNKENVYSDYLENKITRSNRNNSKTEELLEYLKNNSNLNIIYPKESLIKNRNNYNTYYKYDTHWNDYGAYLGTMELMKSIDENFESPKIDMSTKVFNGDLLKIGSLYNSLENIEPTVTNFYDNIKYECKEDIEFHECTSSNSIYNKTILVVGDSFRKSTIQYLAKLYSKSIFILQSYYNEDLIKKYNPDIVVYETVERYSNALANSDILIK